MPQGWELPPISDVFVVNPRNYVNDATPVSFVPMTLINDGFSNTFSFKERLWGEVKSGYTHFAEGDVGLAKITPCLENRKSVVFNGLINGIGAGTTELHIFRPIWPGVVTSEYLLWFFKSETFISSCTKAFAGAVGQQRVGKSHVESSLLPMPPIAEQRRIVAAINFVFTLIDEIERAKGDLRNAIAAAKSKIFALAIRGKLVSQDPTDEPATVLLERIRAQREQLIKAGKIKRSKAEKAAPASADNSYYESLPDGWCMMPIGELFFIAGGGTPATNIPEYWGEGIPWFSSADIDESGNVMPRRCVTPAGIEHSATNVVPAGSVIIATRVGLGKVALLNTEMCFSQDNHALIPIDPGAISSRFLFHFLLREMQTLKLLGRGTTISGITKKQLADVNLWIPPIAEQIRIVAALESAYTQLNKIVETLS